jgi:Phage integrase family
MAPRERIFDRAAPPGSSPAMNTSTTNVCPFLVAPVAVDRPRHCPDSTLAARQATTVCATRPTRRRSKRSWPSYARPVPHPHGRRLSALIVIMWRAGLRIQEALALTEGDLDQRRGSLLVRRGKGGRRREVGMPTWGWEQLQPWLDKRRALSVGPLLCVINGTTRGRHWSAAAARAELRHTAAAAGVRRRFAPHQLRHAHAVEMAREGVPLIVIQRQLGQQPRHHLRLPTSRRQRRDHRARARPTRADDPRQHLAAPLIPGRRSAARRAMRHSAARVAGSSWQARRAVLLPRFASARAAPVGALCGGCVNSPRPDSVGARS